MTSTAPNHSQQTESYRRRTVTTSTTGLKMRVFFSTLLFGAVLLLTRDADAAKGGVRGAGVLR